MLCYIPTINILHRSITLDHNMPGVIALKLRSKLETVIALSPTELCSQLETASPSFTRKEVDAAIPQLPATTSIPARRKIMNYAASALPPTSVTTADLAEAVARLRKIDGKFCPCTTDDEARGVVSKRLAAVKNCPYCKVSACCMSEKCSNTPLGMWFGYRSGTDSVLSRGSNGMRCSPGVHLCNPCGVKINSGQQSRVTKLNTMRLKDGRIVSTVHYVGPKSASKRPPDGTLDRSSNTKRRRAKVHLAERIRAVQRVLVEEQDTDTALMLLQELLNSV
jgi:hypothetical protein